MHTLGELDLIAHIRALQAAKARGSVALGIGDDAAILRSRADDELVVTTDLCLEGRHFRRDWHPAMSAGHRCLARGLSDLAAMGAKPVAAFLSLAVPRATAQTAEGRRWLKAFLAGLDALATANSVVLAGGDTAEAPGEHLIADIILIGSVPRGQALRRDGARPGDRLYVTGALGGTAAELASLAKRTSLIRAKTADLHHPQLYPAPRLAVGQALVRRSLASACMDLSDGLSTDLTHLCAASKVGAVVDASSLPLHTLAREGSSAEEAISLALHGGEDYELLFTAPPTTRIPRVIARVPVTAIGRITTAFSGIQIQSAEGAVKPLRPGGWQHLR